MHSPAAWTLFVVVVIFVICQTWRCIVNITAAVILDQQKDVCWENEKNPNIGVPYWLLILQVVVRIACILNR